MAKSGKPLYGGIEAGGTKFVCAIGTRPDDLEDLVEIPTRDPESTIQEVTRFFLDHCNADKALTTLGIGSFGPLDLNTSSPNFGCISRTPKNGWDNVDLLGKFKNALNTPVILDTDVNAAAIGERAWGAAVGLDHFLYVTIGTGVGVGAIMSGELLTGSHHPEMGHMLIPRGENEPDAFDGVCPFHSACVEGLASGSAIVQRWGARLEEFEPDHLSWQLEADYLSSFFSNLTFSFQPQKIIVGGGVMQQSLLEMVRDKLHAKLGGYQAALSDRDALDTYLVTPKLGHRAGVLGAIALARGDNGNAEHLHT